MAVTQPAVRLITQASPPRRLFISCYIIKLWSIIKGSLLLSTNMGLFIVILPLIIATAYSPVMLGTVIAILSHKHKPSEKIMYYGAGAMSALVILTSIALSSSRFLEAILPLNYILASNIINILIGIFLVLLALWISRKPPSDKPMKITNNKIYLFILGLVMTIGNYTSMPFYLTAMKEIIISSSHLYIKIIAILVMDYAMLVPIMLPMLIYGLGKRRGQIALGKIQTLVHRYSNTIIIYLLNIVGIYLIIKGLLGVIINKG